MLVLARKQEQRIVIGDTIEIVIVDIRGDKVRLGIMAPKEIAVDRYEVHIAKQATLGAHVSGSTLGTTAEPAA